jgi:hypothetical protein
MDPNRADPSAAVGRFHGNPLISDDGGTAFFRFGSLLSQATSPSTKLEPNATETVFWMNFFIAYIQHTAQKIANSNSTNRLTLNPPPNPPQGPALTRRPSSAAHCQTSPSMMPLTPENTTGRAAFNASLSTFSSNLPQALYLLE